MNCYDATKSILLNLESENLANRLDLNIGQFLTEMDENNEELYISANMRYAYRVNTYSCMYSACFQALIDQLEGMNNPLSQCLWKIKAGYNKLINGYFTKFNEIDQENKVFINF